MKKNINLLIAMTLAVSATFANTQRCEYIEGKLLAKFKVGIAPITGATPTTTGIAKLDSLNTTYRCSGMEPLIPRTKKDDPANPLLRTYVFTFKTTTPIEKLIAAYIASGLFEYLEPDYVTHGSSVEKVEGYIPNDQYFNRQWALNNDGTFNMGGMFNPKDDADIDMPEAWEIEQGDTSIIIAILDSGCKMDHPELAGRLWKNGGEIAGNGIDDDGNGYIDDVNGWDFINNDNEPSDDNGHGTTLTGAIGANTNNEIGFAGVNPNARIMVLKILDSLKIGKNEITAKAINYAVDKKANIINLSIAHNIISETEREAVQFAYNKTVTIIAGTGNDNAEEIAYPAAYDEVIAIGATGPDDKRYIKSDSVGSNYGTEINMVAPGSYIFVLDNIDVNKYNYYVFGTSISTAYTTGVASLLLAKNPTLTPTQIREILQQSADDQVGDPAEDTKGWDKYFGWGRLNAFKALTLASAVKNTRYRPQMAITQPKSTLTLYNLIKPAGTACFTLNGKSVNGKALKIPAKLTPGIYIRRPERYVKQRIKTPGRP